MKSRSPIRNSLWLVIAVMAFFAMAGSSPQCAKSTDRALDPGLETLAGGNECIANCNDLRAAAFHAEKIAFKLAKAVCNGDGECKAQAEAEHALNQAAINADMDACKADCQHEQGVATGGQ